MFERLFVSVGPLGAAAFLLVIVAVLFAVALSETLRLARPGRSWSVGHGLAALRPPRWIARRSPARDSHQRHALAPCVLVRRWSRRIEHRLGTGATDRRRAG